MILMKNITRDGNPVLRKVAEPLTFPLSDHYKKLADDMMEYLINSQDPKIAEKHQLRAGVGLAAPQVGESVQMAALLVPDDEGNIIFKDTFVNPEIPCLNFSGSSGILLLICCLGCPIFCSIACKGLKFII